MHKARLQKLFGNLVHYNTTKYPRVGTDSTSRSARFGGPVPQPTNGSAACRWRAIKVPSQPGSSICQAPSLPSNNIEILGLAERIV